METQRLMMQLTMGECGVGQRCREIVGWREVEVRRGSRGSRGERERHWEGEK